MENQCGLSDMAQSTEAKVTVSACSTSPAPEMPRSRRAISGSGALSVASDHRFVPQAVFSGPQVACVGLTEAQCRAQGLRHAVGVRDYGGVAYGWAMEDTDHFAKVIADPATGRLLGAHIIGPDAPNLIQPLVQAMSFGQDVRTVARGQYWIHPALAEVVENALLAVELDG